MRLHAPGIRTPTGLLHHVVRASPAEYLSLKLRAHELLHDVPLHDVSVVDLPGGGDGRRVADIRALDSAAAPSRLANSLFGLRRFLGRVFGYGTFDLESAGQDQALKKVDFIPYPEQLYLEVCALLFPSKDPADD